jgi:hypothetical protein
MIKLIREKLKGWRTVIVGALVGLPLAAIEVLDQLKVLDWQSALPAPWGGRLALVISLAMILLRMITSTPVGTK